MIQHRELAATIARAIFDRIERDRTLILQNIEEVIRDQLAIEEAKQVEIRTDDHGTWIDETAPIPDEVFERLMRRAPPVSSAPPVPWGSLKNWWMTEPGPEAGE